MSQILQKLVNICRNYTKMKKSGIFIDYSVYWLSFLIFLFLFLLLCVCYHCWWWIMVVILPVMYFVAMNWRTDSDRTVCADKQSDVRTPVSADTWCWSQTMCKSFCTRRTTCHVDSAQTADAEWPTASSHQRQSMSFFTFTSTYAYSCVV